MVTVSKWNVTSQNIYKKNTWYVLVPSSTFQTSFTKCKTSRKDKWKQYSHSSQEILSFTALMSKALIHNCTQLRVLIPLFRITAQPSHYTSQITYYTLHIHHISHHKLHNTHYTYITLHITNYTLHIHHITCNTSHITHQGTPRVILQVTFGKEHHCHHNYINH